MAFDQTTRNRLNRFVGEARALLTEEFARQLQSDYGIDPGSGRVDDVAGIVHLDDRQRETARILRDTLHHYMAGKEDKKTRIAAIDRILREQAFTVLNRLAALRMMEARGLLISSIAEGTRSDGFQLYQGLAGVALGETDEAYITYLFSLFDEFAVDLPVLFDRFSPQGRLFPSVAVLRRLLGLINDAEIAPLWAEDETIGWIYQYFNSSEERRQMRKASSAPRNSRELAVRNQFFTPRYVVEFLTDNTLGRIWYEMTKGETRLVDECDYLVRRPRELFLGQRDSRHDRERLPDWLKKAQQGDFSDLPEQISEGELVHLSFTIDGYAEARRLGYGDLTTWAKEQLSTYQESGDLPADAIELWLLMFAMQRQHRFTMGDTDGSEDDAFLATWKALYHAWKEAVQRDTSDMLQEELLQQPVFIPHRPLKDPREIRLLDPACGSMHFGLYAFDLFETIYEEAWDRELLGEWAADYRDKNDFMRDVPRLIIEHNIHGIDIDARAVQIAGLSLWLRAQRSWQAQETTAGQRPTVARSNIVVAEPMPGNETELKAFLAAQFGTSIQDQIVAGLVQSVFDAMKLAGEAGTLLKVEEEIADDLSAARAKWKVPHQGGLFEQPQQAALLVDMTSVSENQFWEHVEERIYAALEAFAEQAAQSETYRRHLFAEDAARGFAFIDLCRQRYDVALMNPPFGERTKSAKLPLSQSYPLSKDMFAHFVDRGRTLLVENGILGAITARTGFFLKSFNQWREELLEHTPPTVFADLGFGVLDAAMVETAAYCLNSTHTRPIFFQVNAVEDKDYDLLRKINRANQGTLTENSYCMRLSDLETIPNKPLAYWISPQLLKIYGRLPRYKETGPISKQGLATADDFRYVRAVWEVPSANISTRSRDFVDSGKMWAMYAKGGSTPYYRDLFLVVNWRKNGSELMGDLNQRGNIRSNIWMLSETSKNFFFRSGLTWPRRPSTQGFFRVLPTGVVFGVNSCGTFSNRSSDYQLATMCLLNSPVFAYLIQFQFSRGFTENGQSMTYEVGYVENTPVPPLTSQNKAKLSVITRDSVALLQSIDQTDEISRLFCSAFSADRNITSLKAVTNSYNAVQLKNSTQFVANIQAANDIVFESYGVSPSSIETTVQEASGRALESVESIKPVTSYDTVNSTLSYLVGTIFGRWDIRYAIGEKKPPEIPDPFAPLPICPPGMLQNADGLPATPSDVSDKYLLQISWPGILVDDDGHPEDIVGRIREALHVIWGENADDIEAEACSLLGVDSLRDYFGNPNKFFDDHLSRYSKSRRYAPIYWPLTTTNGSYTLWLYYHRLDDNILYRCVNDFVDPKLAAVERQLNGLRNRKRDRDEERELEELTDLAVELETFRNDLLELARFWRPNLNDGVEITAAPLYALFGNRKWRNRLEKTWDKLQEGEYDWAHLAMSIWPSRVVPKCVEDRSLAIAHDIEKLFWVEEDENWRPLRSPAEEETHQVEIRQSEERERLRDLLADLVADEGRSLPAMQVWQSLNEGEWDHRPLGLHLYPERAAEAAFEDATDVYHNLTTRGQKLLQKDTKKNKRLLTKRLVERGTPELVAAVEATLAGEPEAIATLWQALESGKRDDSPLALELWPERVVGKAQNDPQLAATHGLFDFFWYDEPGRGVRRRKSIRREIANEVERRGGDRGDGGRL